MFPDYLLLFQSCQSLSKDLASLEANRFHSLDANGMSKNGVLFFYHRLVLAIQFNFVSKLINTIYLIIFFKRREDVDLDFGMVLLRELGETVSYQNVIIMIHDRHFKSELEAIHFFFFYIFFYFCRKII